MKTAGIPFFFIMAFFVLLGVFQRPAQAADGRHGGPHPGIWKEVSSRSGTAHALLAATKRRRGSGGWGLSTRYGRKFDPKTVQTVRGKVVSVERFTPLRNMFYGYLVILKTAEESIPVHLGPGRYVDRVGFKLSPGDEVIVRGSRAEFHGSIAIIATRVQKGNRVLELRTDQGVPLWSEEYQQQ